MKPEIDAVLADLLLIIGGGFCQPRTMASRAYKAIADLTLERDEARAAHAASPAGRDEPDLKRALEGLVYETTHLSPEESDGSHWCKISRDALQKARSALARLPASSTKPDLRPGLERAVRIAEETTLIFSESTGLPAVHGANAVLNKINAKLQQIRQEDALPVVTDVARDSGGAKSMGSVPCRVRPAPPPIALRRAGWI